MHSPSLLNFACCRAFHLCCSLLESLIDCWESFCEILVAQDFCQTKLCRYYLQHPWNQSYTGLEGLGFPCLRWMESSLNQNFSNPSFPSLYFWSLSQTLDLVHVFVTNLSVNLYLWLNLHFPLKYHLPSGSSIKFSGRPRFLTFFLNSIARNWSMASKSLDLWHLRLQFIPDSMKL